MWLTLLALLIGEQLMGIPGMILAPVILSFIKVEMKKIGMGDGRFRAVNDRIVAAARIDPRLALVRRGDFFRLSSGTPGSFGIAVGR